MAVLGENSKAKLKGVHPNLVKVIEEAIKDTPIDFSVISGVRTTAEQKALYAQGRTTKGAIVTNADGVKAKSNHQIKADGFGHAIDFVPFVNGKVDWNTESNFRTVANHIVATGKSLGINVESGMNWRFKDLPHIQLV